MKLWLSQLAQVNSFSRRAEGGQVGRVVELGPEIGPERGHEQGRADALARDVAHGQAEAPAVDGDDVVVVAADLEAGQGPPGHAVAFEGRERPGQEIALDVGGDLELASQLLRLDEGFDLAGLLDPHGGGVGHQREQAEVGVPERPLPGVPVGVEHADDVRFVPDGDAEGRVDPLADDAVRVDHPRVHLGVGEKDGEVLLVGHVDDRPADLDLPGRAADGPGRPRGLEPGAAGRRGA